MSSIFLHMRKIGEILKEICGLEGVEKFEDSALARIFDTKPSTIKSWRDRETIPWEALYYYCDRRGINLKWLLTGEGPMTARDGDGGHIAEELASYNIDNEFEQSMNELRRYYYHTSTDETDRLFYENRLLVTVKDFVKHYARKLELQRGRAITPPAEARHEEPAEKESLSPRSEETDRRAKKASGGEV